MGRDEALDVAVHAAAPRLWIGLRQPTRSDMVLVRDAHRAAPYTYDLLGATWGDLPRGWVTDDRGIVLGRGRDVFDQATEALRRFVHFDLPWVRVLDPPVPLRAGELFTFASNQYGTWVINVCRIVEVVEERDEETARFGYAYGTVGGHAVRGEERFLVEWDRHEDVVRFGIRKFSLPASWVVRMAGPLTRRVQERFTAEALERLRQEVAP